MDNDRQGLVVPDADSSKQSVWNFQDGLQLGRASGARRNGTTARLPADLGRLGRRRGDDDVTNERDDVTDGVDDVAMTSY